jgi:hypothetical protein
MLLPAGHTRNNSKKTQDKHHNNRKSTKRSETKALPRKRPRAAV